MIVLDTHVLVWWLVEPQKLSRVARRTINNAARDHEVAVSAISVFEISTLTRRGRLQLAIEPDQWFAALHSLPELAIEPVSAEIAWIAGTFDDALSGDPADRIITATASALGARLITADEKLRTAAPVETIW